MLKKKKLKSKEETENEKLFKNNHKLKNYYK